MLSTQDTAAPQGRSDYAQTERQYHANDKKIEGQDKREMRGVCESHEGR